MKTILATLAVFVFFIAVAVKSTPKKEVITIYSNYDIYYLTNTSLTSESGNINLFSIDRCKLIDSLETLTADDVNRANGY